MPSRSAAPSRACLLARTLKPMMMAFEAEASVHVGFGDAADAAHQDLRRHFVGAELVERGDDGFDRALHVALDDQREFLLTGDL
jgi:hypothetical protein